MIYARLYCYNALVNAHEQFIFLQCANILTTCVGPVLNLVALYLRFASIGMATSSLLIGLICRIAYFAYVRKHMHIKARYDNLPTHLIKEILTFSFWIFLANIVSQLYNATDTLLIGAIPALATASVAVYSVGNTFNSIVFSLSTGMSSLLTPKANKMVFQSASNQELTDLCIRVGRIQCLIISLVVSGFISFGKPFIYFYAGESYLDAYWVAVLMMVPNMIPLVQSMCLSIVTAQNRHRFRSIVYLIIAIMNVIGTWILLQNYGIIGAAFMTGFALILGTGFTMNWYYHKRTGLDMIRFWKIVGRIYIIPIMMCVITLGILRFVDLYNLPALLIGIALYTVVYCILTWMLVMNNYEKSLIKEPISRLLAKIRKNMEEKQ